MDRAPRGPLLLAIVPLVCVYVDIVCYHSDLRVIAIATFLRTHLHHDEFSRRYEWFCQKNRGAFGLENFAMYWATFGLSVLVGGSPWMMPSALVPSDQNVLAAWNAARPWLLVAGLLGTLSTSWVRFYFKTSCEKIEADREGERRPGIMLLVVACVASLLVASVLALVGTAPSSSAAVRMLSNALPSATEGERLADRLAAIVLAGAAVPAAVLAVRRNGRIRRERSQAQPRTEA